jgi:hypothetical protein
MVRSLSISDSFVSGDCGHRRCSSHGRFPAGKRRKQGSDVEPGKTSFKVKEKNGGTSGISFSYRVMAHRVHYQEFRFGFDPKFGDTDTRSQFKDQVARPIESADYYKMYGDIIEKEKAQKAKAQLEKTKK